jgi:putative transposase
MKRWAREWAKETAAIDWEKLLPPRGFRVLPRRWVAERTFSWLGQKPQDEKDYERLAETSETFMLVAMIRMMLKRLAHA